MWTENRELAATKELNEGAALSALAIARRRAVLKGIGKGSAVMVAAVPIHTLAANTILGGGKLATVSGSQSVISSQQTGPQTISSGYAPSYYETVANWPNYTVSSSTKKSEDSATANSAVNGIAVNPDEKFKDIFGHGSRTKLLDILKNSPASDEAAWVTALLNAIKNPAGFNYPYSAPQVLAFYNDTNPLKVAQALAFFKGYMQTVVH